MSTTRRPQVLYVGPFRLPDFNAAAQRVLANAKALRSLGYEVVLAETGHAEGLGGPPQRLPDHDGFICHRLPMKEKGIRDHPLVSIRQVKDLLDGLENPQAVIAYNFPSVPLARLERHCRRMEIACAADVTEWHGVGHISSGLAKLLKWTDTAARMRVVHKRLDALVVISSFLEEFYSSANGPRVVKVPPLVDSSEDKWHHHIDRDKSDALRLVWAGSSSPEKERLDKTVAAVVDAADFVRVHLDVVGITADEFARIYSATPLPSPECVTFHGRVSHREALGWVAQADYSVIVRDRSRKNEAGFPTKFVESVTLGTPALVSPHPDLIKLVSDNRNGAVVAIDNLAEELIRYHGAPAIPVDRHTFDIKRYQAQFAELAEALGLDR